MISCAIPGRDMIEIRHLVCDVNGTLTRDGCLLPGVRDSLEQLKGFADIHLVSADTFGRLTEIENALSGVITAAARLKPGGEAEQKMEYVQKLGSSATVAVGQGTNDRLMLKVAVLGVCILSTEGAALETLLNSDIVVPDILSAFDLFLKPDRLKATLRQ